MHHPWHRLKIRLRDAAKAINAPIHLRLIHDASGVADLTALAKPESDLVVLGAAKPDWAKPTTVQILCDGLTTKFALRPSMIASTPRSLNPTEQNLLSHQLAEAASIAVKEARLLIGDDVRAQLDRDIRRSTLLARVFDRVRLTLAFSQFYVLRSLHTGDSAEILFHSEKADLTLDQPQIIKLAGPLHAALSRRQPATGELPAADRMRPSEGLQFIACPVDAPSSATVSLETTENAFALLVLAGPVPFPGDKSGTGSRRVSFLDYALIQELAGLVRTVLGDFHMQRDLSHNYEMAFHGTGRSVDSIAGAFAYLMEALYGFVPEVEKNVPPVVELKPLTDGANPKRIQELITANYANALTVANQIHRFELSKPKMYRYAIEVIEKPVKECISPIVRNLRHYDIVHNAPGATRVNHLTSVKEFPEPILADRRALQIVFSNLIENAIKYRKRSAAAQLNIGWVNGEHHVDFVFSDNGLGLRSGEETAIFHPYFRGTAAKQHGIQGSGLGLATARELLLGMSGSIRVERNPNETRFVVRLPRPAYTLRR